MRTLGVPLWCFHTKRKFGHTESHCGCLHTAHRRKAIHENSEKVAICKPGEASQETRLDDTLMLGHSGHRVDTKQMPDDSHPTFLISYCQGAEGLCRKLLLFSVWHLLPITICPLKNSSWPGTKEISWDFDVSFSEILTPMWLKGDYVSGSPGTCKIHPDLELSRSSTHLSHICGFLPEASISTRWCSGTIFPLFSFRTVYFTYLFIKAFLFVYDSCDISVFTYIISWVSSSPPSFSLLPSSPS
jgi:hypothetical protein